jgi:hypothetical protein
VIALWLLGCGPPTDFCEREAAWRERCDDAATGPGIRTCERSLKTCSEEDLVTLDDYAACLDAADCSSESFLQSTGLHCEQEDPLCGFQE